MCLHEGNPVPDGSFDEIREYLTWLWERWEEMRGVMRADLGVDLDPDLDPDQGAGPRTEGGGAED
ncbi:hypothetical protein ACGF07_23625 [Kitasatospora sp. NPDC048194]|uniref:hypothetical protein n=1 Tax=Kitasatospora sp. NPDC048194 TaxID=3364045 RepID=UPI00371DCF87